MAIHKPDPNQPSAPEVSPRGVDPQLRHAVLPPPAPVKKRNRRFLTATGLVAATLLVLSFGGCTLHFVNGAPPLILACTWTVFGGLLYLGEKLDRILDKLDERE